MSHLAQLQGTGDSCLARLSLASEPEWSGVAGGGLVPVCVVIVLLCNILTSCHLTKSLTINIKNNLNLLAADRELINWWCSQCVLFILRYSAPNYDGLFFISGVSITVESCWEFM